MKIGTGPTRSYFPIRGTFYPCSAPVGQRVTVDGIGTATTVAASQTGLLCDWCGDSYTAQQCHETGYGTPGHTCPKCDQNGGIENMHSDEGHPGEYTECPECAPMLV